VPVLCPIKAWLNALRPEVTGNSGTPNAIDHILRHWPALSRYPNDGA